MSNEHGDIGLTNIERIERLALKNTGLPPDLTAPEQFLFLSMRILYRDFRAGYIDQARAKTEKSKIIEQYRTFELGYRISKQHVQIYNRADSKLSEANKSDCPTCKWFAGVLTGLI